MRQYRNKKASTGSVKKAVYPTHHLSRVVHIGGFLDVVQGREHTRGRLLGPLEVVGEGRGAVHVAAVEVVVGHAGAEVAPQPGLQGHSARLHTPVRQAHGSHQVEGREAVADNQREQTKHLRQRRVIRKPHNIFKNILTPSIFHSQGIHIKLLKDIFFLNILENLKKN